MTIDQRFWAKVARRGPDECWVWTASRTAGGYGQIKVPGTVLLAHRVAYELTRGPIPSGAVIDHACRNRACVNPAHLRPVTQKQNAENRAAAGVGRSGLRGVVWDRSRQKWAARLTHNYRTVNLGRFDTPEEAAAAVRAARLTTFTHSTTDREEVAS